MATYGRPEAISHFERAAELDPNFALAYRWLASCHNNFMQYQLEFEYATKAYQLRERVSRRHELDMEPPLSGNGRMGEGDFDMGGSSSGIPPMG